MSSLPHQRRGRPLPSKTGQRPTPEEKLLLDQALAEFERGEPWRDVFSNLRLTPSMTTFAERDLDSIARCQRS